MKFARAFVIFTYGLFTIASEALLFREFITTFESNDISVGIFFASWFLWIGLGALLVYKTQALSGVLVKNVEILLLCYVPAFALQWALIIQARELAGFESYALLPLPAVLLLSIVINAPVSIITGIFFPTACRWQKNRQSLAVSDVYIMEAAGSFIGGLGVTVLLALSVSTATIFFILALLLSCSVFFLRLAKITGYTDPAQKKLGKVKALLALSLPLCVAAFFALGTDKTLTRYVQLVKWTKLLPKSAFAGSFQTAQAEYLYGLYHDQWVAVSRGAVCEALPDRSTSGRIAALCLCQNPNAGRMLVVGSGLGLCYEFLRLPQTESVTWASFDSQYIQKVDTFVPARFKLNDKRLHRQTADVRELLRNKKHYFDIVIVNLPEATSSVLNRYYTLEFYRLIKQSLRPAGVLGVRVTGGENIMGTELVNLGASVKLTLEKVFSQIVLTPGESTWFIASDSKSLTGKPGLLRDRFAAIKGAEDVFPPDALFSVYLPDRAALARQSYSNADLPERLLLNRDARPLTHLYSLLLAAKQSGAPITKFVKNLALVGLLPFLIPILVFAALRAAFILKTDQNGTVSGFDSGFLVFSAGLVGIGVVIVLMYLYQTRFGSLYLYIGVISSVFMLGLTSGAAVIRHMLLAAGKSPFPQDGENKKNDLQPNRVLAP